MGLTGEDLAAFVVRSCEAQGVPVFVTDAAVLARVCALVGTAPPAPAAGGRTAPASQAPHQLDTVRVEAASSWVPGPDHGVVDDRPHDRDLAVQVEVRPPAA